MNDKYKYAAEKRDKYCRMTPTQKFKLAQLISRDVDAGIKYKFTKEKIQKEFKKMKGSKKELKEGTNYDLKRNYKKYWPVDCAKKTRTALLIFYCSLNLKLQKLVGLILSSLF